MKLIGLVPESKEQKRTASSPADVFGTTKVAIRGGTDPSDDTINIANMTP
jgi:hypothetical protein